MNHKEIDIDEKNPFAHCKLDRQPYAEALTQIVESYASGFVFAINNEWGTGKTTFIRMWRQYLILRGFRTIYLNAWENDFETNPLTALLAELKAMLPKDKTVQFNALLKKAGTIAQNILPNIAKSLANKHLGQDFSQTISDATKGATEILKDEIKSYSERQKGMKEFRTELETFVKSLDGKPLVFFVDELDRCRPDYSVELLEQIKHFFTVPGIVFVLAIDKRQLSNAVKGAYGSHELNTDEYLRRFFDLEFSIPEPDTEKYCNYLYDYFDFDSFFKSHDRMLYFGRVEENQTFVKFAAKLFETKRLTLRQQEKLFSHARIAINCFDARQYLFPPVYLLLLYIKSFYPPIYSSLINRQFPANTFIVEMEKLLPENIPNDDFNFYRNTLGVLLVLYHNFYKELNFKSELIEKLPGNVLRILFEPGTKFNIDNDWFLSFMERNSDLQGLSLTHLTNKLELLENIKPK